MEMAILIGIILCLVAAMWLLHFRKPIVADLVAEKLTKEQAEMLWKVVHHAPTTNQVSGLTIEREDMHVALDLSELGCIGLQNFYAAPMAAAYPTLLGEAVLRRQRFFDAETF